MAAVAIRGTTYPVVLPKLRDPRLHLAATITSLQVLGQVAFHFRVSIAQILLCLGTAGAIEVALTLRKHVIMWPASALLTGNGVAFVLRVPGTQHGDWWSLRGWWIFMATAGGALLSKHVIQWRGTHWFNPSNIGLVVCFLVLGRGRVEPLEFWWGPMTWWMVLALAIIVTGGFAILSRLKLLRVALGFWFAFAVSIGVLALAGHRMTAQWHLGPIGGIHFWWVLVTSPEVLVFLFFMITDPKTAPPGGRGRIVYAASLGVLAGVLIAPTTTEFAAKVALLSSLAVVCAVQPLLRFVPRRAVVLAAAPALALAAGVLVFANGTTSTLSAAPLRAGALPPITILSSPGVQSQLTMPTAQQIAHGLLAAVPGRATDTLRIHLVPGTDQSPPTAVAQLAGSTYDLHVDANGIWSLASGAARPQVAAAPGPTSTALAGTRLTDVASTVGLDFQQGSFRYGVSNDVKAMMGGGVCWLDYNGDGWQDLFVVNSYASADADTWRAHGGLPTSQLYENDHGSFHDVTAQTNAGLAVQGDGCVAADLNGDGRTDLVVTTAQGVDVLWNDGHGFTRAALPGNGWYTGAAVADVNGDGRPDLFVAGYSDPNEPVQGSVAGFPTNLTGVRDLLFLNEGGRRFREVGVQAGLEASSFRHGLGAEFVDYNHDGRPDLYVANDEDPNDLYENVPWPGGARADPAGLGFRFEERAGAVHVADPFAGMGIATGEGLLLVSNSRNEPSAVYRAQGNGFANGRSLVDPALGSGFAGWGVSFVDLANSGRPDLVLTAGAIPVTNLAANAEPLRVLAPTGGASFGNAPDVLPSASRINGRGLAAADADNDGRMEVAVNTIGGKLLLLRPTGPSGHWLDVALARFAPGAVVSVTAGGRTVSRTVAAGSSYLSSEDPRLHFGLGAATSVARVVVRYPSGATRVLRNVPADRIVHVAAPPAKPAAPPSNAGCAPRAAHGSAATVWDETAIAVLRTGKASEPVQARDLFDLASAMRSAAPFGPAAVGFASYRLLLWQASLNENLRASFALLTSRMRALCLKPDSAAAARGNRIAAAAIRAGAHDGSLERLHYADPSYTPVNAPLIVAQAVSTVHDPTLWQPLDVQSFVGSQWGGVRTFAGRARATVAPFASATAPAYEAAALAAIRATAPSHPPAPVDTSPLVWNAIAAAHAPGRLLADVRLYFAVNAALNDAAVSTWSAKRVSDAPRPISMIRYLAFNSQLPLVAGLTEKRGDKILVRSGGRWIDGARWVPREPTPASPGGVSEGSAFAAAASTVLASLTGTSFSADAARLGAAGIAGGIDTPAAERAGRVLGRTVGAHVLAKLGAG